MFPQKFGSLTH